MTSVGMMASSVVVSAGTDVLLEPFNNFTFAPWTNTGATIVTGRNGTAASVTGSTGLIRYTIPAVSESDTVTIGFAFKFLVAGGTPRMFELWSDTDTVEHTRVSYSGTAGTLGSLNVQRAGTSLGTTANGLVVQNTWAYIELQIRLHDTLGTVVLRVNGVVQLNLTGLDTKNAGTKTTFDRVRMGPQVGGATSQYDDLYLTTGAGAAFKGDIVVP